MTSSLGCFKAEAVVIKPKTSSELNGFEDASTTPGVGGTTTLGVCTVVGVGATVAGVEYGVLGGNEDGVLN